MKRDWLKPIASRTKRIEYREIKPYWEERLSRVKTPSKLRLINGIQPKAPEVTLTVTKVRRNGRSGNFELMLGKIVQLKYWSVRTGRPTGNR